MSGSKISQICIDEMMMISLSHAIKKFIKSMDFVQILLTTVLWVAVLETPNPEETKLFSQLSTVLYLIQQWQILTLYAVKPPFFFFNFIWNKFILELSILLPELFFLLLLFMWYFQIAKRLPCTVTRHSLQVRLFDSETGKIFSVLAP